MSNTLDAARIYLQHGLSIIPLAPLSKIPIEGFDVMEYRSRLATEEEIQGWWGNDPNMNIGIVTGNLSGIVVIDLDKYDEKYSEEITKEYFGENLECPRVESPNGGQHLYFKNPEDANLTIGARKLPGIDLRGEGGYIVAPPSMGTNGKKYRWSKHFTRKILPDLTRKAIDALYQSSSNSSNGIYTNTNNIYNNNKSTLYRADDNSCGQDANIAHNAYTILQKGTRDDDLFHIANWLLKGGRGENYVKQVLEILGKNANPPFPPKELSLKIQSALSRQERRERNLTDEVKEFCCLQGAHILLTECQQSLQLLTREEKKHLYVIIKRLCDSGFLERVDDQRGSYRVREQQKNEIDIASEPEVNDVKVRLPLQLNDMCVISPGNIIVVAGSKSAGKTAMLMNIANLNCDDFNVHYLNSEMADTEFKKRLKKFMPLKDWNIRAYRCHNNFSDYIESDPKNLYIVDFLEIHDNFYEIAKPIRKIHERLGDSLCFIAIHMKLGSNLGRGGDFSAEKARLYLTMDYLPTDRKTKVTIYDAKEPRPPHESVRGMFRTIKVLDGSSLVMQAGDNWRHSDGITSRKQDSFI